MITDKELIAKISEDVRYDLAILKDDTLLLESSYSNWKDEIDDKKKYWKKRWLVRMCQECKNMQKEED